MPAGALVTLPPGLPITETERREFVKVAVRSWNESIVTVQVPLPRHAPPQPRNSQPGLGLALRLTCATPAKFAKQAPPPPQLMPDGELVTMPEPSSLTARVVAQRFVS